MRRIVTGYQAGGSTIVEDALLTNAVEYLPGLRVFDAWVTDRTPADLEAPTPAAPDTLIPQPHVNGSLFRIVDIPPDTQILGKEAIQQLSGLSSNTQRHPLMHETPSIDYVIVLSGEVHLVLEQNETVCRTGDIVIQRGTNHAWSNRSDNICRIAAILIHGTRS